MILKSNPRTFDGDVYDSSRQTPCLLFRRRRHRWNNEPFFRLGTIPIRLIYRACQPGGRFGGAKKPVRRNAFCLLERAKHTFFGDECLHAWRG
jgi:hypothetical protein